MTQVDQAWMASMVNVNRGIDTIKRAIDADEAHRYEDACALYDHRYEDACVLYDEGIRYLTAAMEDGHPERSRVLIREEIVLYIRRVLTIRMHLQEQAEALHRPQANRLLPADYHPRWLPFAGQRWLPLIRQQWAPLKGV